MYSEDMADACIHLMNLPDETFNTLLGSDEAATVGEDLTIRQLAETVRAVVGYQGNIEFDSTKPDGTPRKLMDVSRLHSLGWHAKTTLQDGMAMAYEDFRGDHHELGAGLERHSRRGRRSNGGVPVLLERRLAAKGLCIKGVSHAKENDHHHG